ncbi:GrpB family protein [Geodermatophilus sp. DSM 44513]|uniref:GrpB family protein n=1 Tax=Geodermatophilus sp. DSM 44513 TaxID=1528104 RepID=UPI00127468B4|nr:GrpB family protein [Geodermatophilus sp. DSM 44513]WNV73597.1 GrpB family protein [Geodermatophilus sp. DSM 44513]
MADWPAWATERVEIHPADPEWQRRGEQACRDLDAALAAWLVAPVEHVGSTAVPGLAAKPILDLQAAVADLDCAPLVVEALGEEWRLVPPELDARPWRRFLVHVVNDTRAAHLHLMAPDSERWAQQLTFRDALRQDPGLVRQYADLKRQLAAEHTGDREAYTAAKRGFIDAVRRGRRPWTTVVERPDAGT